MSRTLLALLLGLCALAATPRYVPPRTPWGDPDLQGTYTNKYELNTPFERPKEFIGEAVEIAGSQLTNREAAEVFSCVLGRKVRFQRLPLPAVRLVLGKEFYQMFRWFNASGFKADIEMLRRCHPEVHLRTLEEWLRDEGWQLSNRPPSSPADPESRRSSGSVPILG